jgi:hypothetical protein
MKSATLKMITLAIVFVLCHGAFVSAAAATVIVNGDFEAPLGPGNGGGNSPTNGPFTLYNFPNQGVPAWTLTAGSIEVFTNYRGSGSQVLDMTGLHTGFPGGQGPGTLQQSFLTLPSTPYDVSFLSSSPTGLRQRSGFEVW